MTDIDSNNPEFAIQEAATNIGLTAIDLASVIYVMKETGGPAPLLRILEGALEQLMTSGGALDAARAGLLAMEVARNQALTALETAQRADEHVIAERDTAQEDLTQLRYDLETWNRSNPDVAALIDATWTAAQDDLIQRARRKGA